nr:hypothetical protein [uncultured Oscillibacter sp.]
MKRLNITATKADHRQHQNNAVGNPPAFPGRAAHEIGVKPGIGKQGVLADLIAVIGAFLIKGVLQEPV